MEPVILPFEISLKVSYPWGAHNQTVTRRVRLSDPSYERMKQTVNELGGVTDPCIIYTDDEGDAVVIGGALEWQECVRLFLTASTTGAVKISLTQAKVRLPKPTISFEHVTVDDRWDDIKQILRSEGMQYPPPSDSPVSFSWVNRRDGCLYISRRKLRNLLSNHYDHNDTDTESEVTCWTSSPKRSITTGTIEVSNCTTGIQATQQSHEVAVNATATGDEVGTETDTPVTVSMSTSTAPTVVATASQVTQICSEVAVETSAPSVQHTATGTTKTVYADMGSETVTGEGSQSTAVGPDFKNISINTTTITKVCTGTNSHDEESYSDGALDSGCEDDQNYSSDFGTESSGVEVQPEPSSKPTEEDDDIISKIKRLRDLGITASDEIILSMLQETNGNVSLALCALLETF